MWCRAIGALLFASDFRLVSRLRQPVLLSACGETLPHSRCKAQLGAQLTAERREAIPRAISG